MRRFATDAPETRLRMIVQMTVRQRSLLESNQVADGAADAETNPCACDRQRCDR
jgi:hypothetical protein